LIQRSLVEAISPHRISSHVSAFRENAHQLASLHHISIAMTRARARNSLLIFAGENSTIIARGKCEARKECDRLIRAYFPAGNEAGRANSPKTKVSRERKAYTVPLSLSLFLTLVNFDASTTESSVERAVIGRNRRCIILFGRIIIAVIRANGAPQQIRLRGSCPAR